MTKPLALLVAGCAGVLLLAGCSSAQSATTTGSTPAGTASGRQGSQTARIPGTFGLIAEITGKTLQVQGTSAQTAVTYTDTTTITRQASGTAADLKAGVCVSVRSAESSGSGTASPASGAGEASGNVTASSITISEPVNGQCQATAFGGGNGAGNGGQPGGGMASGMPSGAMPSGAPGGNGGGMPSGAASGGPGGGMPSGMPSGGQSAGASGQRGGFGRGVSGTVESVSGETFVVKVTQPSGGGTATASPSATTSNVTVTIGSSATITKTVSSDASALKVGLCAWANGSTDNTGAVTATSIRLSDAVNGACTMG